MLWGSARGPRVPPGTYTVRLEMGDWSAEGSFEVRGDPRLQASPADYQAQFELAKRAWEALTESQRALARLRDVRTQVQDLAKRLEDAGHGEGVADAAAAVTDKLTALEERIHQTKAESSQDVLNFPPRLDNQIVALLGSVQGSEARPTAGAAERFADLRQELDAVLAELEAVLATELAAFNELVRGKEVAPVIVPTG